IVQFLQSEPGAFRVADYTVLNGNHGLVYLVPSIDGTYGMFLSRFVTLRKALPSQRAYELLNVRYVLTRDDPGEGASIALSEPFQDHLNRVVRVPNPQERVMVVPEARAIEDDASLLATLAAPDFDMRRSVLLSAPPPEPVAPGSGQAALASYRSNSIEVTV